MLKFLEIKKLKNRKGPTPKTSPRDVELDGDKLCRWMVESMHTLHIDCLICHIFLQSSACLLRYPLPIVLYCSLLFYKPLPKYCKLRSVFTQLADSVDSHLLFVYFTTRPDQHTLYDSPLTNKNSPFLITDDVQVPTNHPLRFQILPSAYIAYHYQAPALAPFLLWA